MDAAEIIKGRVRGIGEKVYISPDIPKDKLNNAVEGITGSSASKDDVVAVLDTTLFGVCDNGVLFTENAMYMKDLFGEVKTLHYSDMMHAEAKGVLVKKLVVTGRNGAVINEFELDNCKLEIVAQILNAIASAMAEEVQAAQPKLGKDSGNEVALEDKTEKDFEVARALLRTHATLLMIAGVVLCCSSLLWWGVPAIISAIALWRKFKDDEPLYKLGLPVDVYDGDTKETIQAAWFGSLIVIGCLGIGELGKKSRRRIDTMNAVMVGLKAMPVEKVITRFEERFKEKNDKLSRRFVRAYLRRMDDAGEILHVDLNGRMHVFSPDCYESAIQRTRDIASSKTRIPRDEFIHGLKEIFPGEDGNVEAFINLPVNEIEPYTFEDGVHYVHGIFNDRIKVCESCGIAHIVDAEGQGESEFFCSDYCRETDAQCRKLVEQLRNEKFKRSGVDSASFGGSLSQVLSSINYNKGNVAARSTTGHGVAAENANTRIDKLLGRSASVVGGDNAKDGADRIVNGVEIQSKYCGSARDSVNEAFAGKGEGNYRYYSSDGKPMQLEVPRDQYAGALEEMRNKIKEGKVPGVTDPNEAENLVRKGHLTYKQAQNLCKFGTIESLAYDAYTGAIVGATAGGISFVLTTALTYYSTKDMKASLRAAVGAGLQTGGKAFAVYVLTAQLQRTAFVKAFISGNSFNINFGGHGKFVERIGKGLDKMSGAKSGTFTKNANVAVKGAVVTAAATFAVTSVWEVGRLCCGKMSGMQCIKNIAVSAGGITGGTAGALILGALMSPIPGGAFVGGLIGGAIGGMVGGQATKAGMDNLIEDDAVMVMAVVSDEFKIIAASFCMNADEIGKATSELDKLISSRKDFVEDVYSKKNARRCYVARLLKPIFIRICMDRPLLLAKDISDKAVESAIGDDE